MSYFSVNAWSSATAYVVDDIVYTLSGSTRTYYYCILAHTNQAVTNTTYWTKEFKWKPSYPVSNRSKPSVRAVKFGDGYEQRSDNGLFNNPLMLEMNFQARSDKEATAILQFFDQKGGETPFKMSLPHPYNTSLEKMFLVREWNHSWTDYNNNTISAMFEEMPDPVT